MGRRLHSQFLSTSSLPVIFSIQAVTPQLQAFKPGLDQHKQGRLWARTVRFQQLQQPLQIQEKLQAHLRLGNSISAQIATFLLWLDLQPPHGTQGQHKELMEQPWLGMSRTWLRMSRTNLSNCKYRFKKQLVHKKRRLNQMQGGFLPPSNHEDRCMQHKGPQ